MKPSPPHPVEDRYSRQWILPFIGRTGQDSIASAHLTIVGCGALGSVQANLLCRAGIGALTLIDRDVVEHSNLQRQVLFNEEDIGRSKVEATREALLRIRSDIEITPIENHLDHRNAEKLLSQTDLILDASDNFITRLIVNDLAVKNSIPWVYGGVIAGEGVFMPFPAGGAPCLCCLLPSPPAPGTTPTCESEGILNTQSTLIAAHQVTEALKIIVGRPSAPLLTQVRIWDNTHHRTAIEADPNCLCCHQKRFVHLDGRNAPQIIPLCKRALQILPPPSTRLSLSAIRSRLALLTPVVGDEHLLRFHLSGEEITLFADGRALFKGSGDTNRCRALYDRYIGE